MESKAVVLNIIASSSDSGKTTLLENLVPDLISKGLRVAVLKGNSQRIDLDKPGKDTWRYLEAGAEMAGIITPEKYMITGTASNEQEIRENATRLCRGLDLVLIEGDKKSNHPKIEIMQDDSTSGPTGAANVIALVSNEEVRGAEDIFSAEIPVFKPDHTAEIADFIFKHFFTPNGERDPKTNAGAPDSLTHFDPKGQPRMVDVSSKETSFREAYARGEIIMNAATLERIKEGTVAKGDVKSVAQVAAVMAVKETGRLIPMAHPLGVSAVEVDFNYPEEESKVEIGVKVKLSGQTGVEMEALTGVSVAALTIYDMCKAIDKGMVIQNIRLEEKKGGRSGHYRREE